MIISDSEHGAVVMLDCGTGRLKKIPDTPFEIVDSVVRYAVGSGLTKSSNFIPIDLAFTIMGLTRATADELQWIARRSIR